MLSDGKEWSNRDIYEHIASKYQLTDDERKETLASGPQPVFINRIGWATTYLKKAGLIDSPRRAHFVIADAGKKVLASAVTRVDIKYLRQFPSFIEFQQASKTEREIANNDVVEAIVETPEEILERGYQQLRANLAAELLSKVIELSPAFFERLVVELLVKMGYGGSMKDAGKAVGRSGDEGIDGTIKEDKLGLDIIYIQAKRWGTGNVVGRPELQKFVGALAGQGAKKGIFITTSSFTKDAREYAPKNETKIVLIDGQELAQLMIDYNLGCTTQQSYELKKIDLDFFGGDE